MKLEKHKITVSEPWDFEGPAGKNLIVGVIVKILSSSYLIFKSDHFIKFGGVEGQLFILKARYEGQNLECLEGTVGGSLIVINDYENQDAKKIEESSKYLIIGTLEKVGNFPISDNNDNEPKFSNRKGNNQD